MFFFKYTLLFLFTLFNLYAKDFALIINANGEKKDNYYRYYKNIKSVHHALVKRGILRSDILTVSGESTECKEEFVKKYGLFCLKTKKGMSFYKDSINDIQYIATTNELRLAFKEMKKNINKNDSLLIFITGHGYQDRGTLMRDNEFFSIDEYYKEIMEFDREIKIFLVTNTCYGGQFLPLSWVSNVLVMTTTDQDTVSHSFNNSSDFAKYFSKNIETPNNSYYQAYFKSMWKDALNEKYLTSFDHFITNELMPIIKKYGPNKNLPLTADTLLTLDEEKIKDLLNQVGPDPQKIETFNFIISESKKLIQKLNAREIATIKKGLIRTEEIMSQKLDNKISDYILNEDDNGMFKKYSLKNRRYIHIFRLMANEIIFIIKSDLNNFKRYYKLMKMNNLEI